MENILNKALSNAASPKILECKHKYKLIGAIADTGIFECTKCKKRISSKL